VTGWRLDRTVLDRLIDRYEALRDRDGMGSMLHRVSPGQRIDALHICVAAYAAGRVPDGDQRDFWLAHLRPVLAETREAARALREAFDELPVEEPKSTLSLRLQQTWRSMRRGLGRWPITSTLSLIGTIFIFVGLVFIAIRYPTTPSTPGVVIRNVIAPEENQPNVPRQTGESKASYERFLRLTLTAAGRYRNEITPYALAAVLTGAEPKLGEPSFFLAEMMRTFPLDPAASVPRTAFGAMALRHYAALAAATLAGQSMTAFDEFIMNDDRLLTANGRYDPAKRLLDFQRAGDRPEFVLLQVPRTELRRETWSPLLRLLPFLILLPGMAWAFWGSSNRRRELMSSAVRDTRSTRAAFRHANAGAWGSSMLLQSSADLPPLPPASRTARRLLRLRETLPDSRLDVERSVRASLASIGDVVTIMRDGSRSVDIVFLVCRRHRHDHERARALRLLDALSRNGVTLTAYDYSPDPRTLTATSRTDAGSGRGPQRTLDLRGLRLLHGDPLLVIVSDGEDLIDRFSLKPHRFVHEELQLWSRRMLLTPIPIAEWGEREMTLAAALNAPVGRATMAGLADLELGLAPDSVQAIPRRILERALRRPGFFERTELWTALAGSILSADATPPRPALVAHLGIAALQEMAPPPDQQEQLVAELKSWLGPGFFWFAACGIYPQLRVDLTLWLGRRLHRYGHPANPGIFSEDMFSRLCLLPWFRVCHMPDWLRAAAFGALSAREKKMAREVIDELAAGRGNQYGSRTLGLQVWQSDWRGQPLTSDDVMLEFKTDPKTSPTTPVDEAEAEAARSAWWRWFTRGSARTAIVAIWAGMVAWLMPAFEAAPLPSGVWWPSISFAGVSVVALAAILICERAGLFRFSDHGRPQAPRPFPDGGDGAQVAAGGAEKANA
jgi:hypothetical protein